MKRSIVFGLVLFSTNNLFFAQTNDTNDIQYGISLMTTLDLNLQHPFCWLT